jgi:hypothetical protein
MKTRFQQKFPEEVELELKRAELACLCQEHAAARAALQQVRDEICHFERMYEQTLGRRIAELERIETEISRLNGYADRPSHSFETRSAKQAEESFSASSASAAREPRSWAPRSDVQGIKALYREVAKAIHPDLGSTGAAQGERHELMARANRAYAQQDRRALQEILRNWKRSPGAVDGSDVAAELVRVIRQIAMERQEIHAVKTTLAELKGSYVCRFKLKIEASLAQGSDLFADMVAAADLNIARALRRLAALQGEVPRDAAGIPAGGPASEKYAAGDFTAGEYGAQKSGAEAGEEHREICFPADDFSGTLYLRSRSSLNFSQWRKVGPAKGCLAVEADQAVRLDVKADPAVKLTQMRKLKPNDLQSLFLYEVADGDLDSIFHLTGLEELYLSGPGLTDAALSGIASLTNLKRIYLYQTVITDRGLVHLQRLPGLKGLTSSGNGITDEGLAIFQKAIPGVKTVSFPWKYKR